MSDAALAHGNDRAFFGHPKGLATLFGTEMWERFSYYGMRAILILFMTASIETGGLGMDVSTAGAVYGTYTAMVYFMCVPGGWLADKVFGLRNAVLYGGILIAAGHYALAIPVDGFFPLGLVLVCLGTGLLKPNISAIVGELYTPADARRDAGFSIFYMGINLGSFFGQLVSGYLAQHPSWRAIITGWGMDPNSAWHWGFGAAGVGMTFGIVQYIWGRRNLGDAGLRPGAVTSPALGAKYKRQALMYGGGVLAIVILGALAAAGGLIEITPLFLRDVAGTSLLVITVVYFTLLFLDKSWTSDERARLWVIVAFFLAAAIFWSVFDQAGSTMNLFADRNTRTEIFGFAFPSSWFQSLNPLFIVIFAPVFSVLWLRLGDRQPSSPVKFAIGLMGAGLGFWVLAVGAINSGNGQLVSPLWLVFVYLIHTWAELCLSPVGLSSMTKLAPARITGAMMGVWFLGASVGNFFAGQMATFYEDMPLERLFGMVAIMPVAAGVLFLVLAKPMTRMMGGVR